MTSSCENSESYGKCVTGSGSGRNPRRVKIASIKLSYKIKTTTDHTDLADKTCLIRVLGVIRLFGSITSSLVAAAPEPQLGAERRSRDTSRDTSRARCSRSN